MKFDDFTILTCCEYFSNHIILLQLLLNLTSAKSTVAVTGYTVRIRATRVTHFTYTIKKLNFYDKYFHIQSILSCIFASLYFLYFCYLCMCQMCSRVCCLGNPHHLNILWICVYKLKKNYNMVRHEY